MLTHTWYTFLRHHARPWMLGLSLSSGVFGCMATPAFAQTEVSSSYKITDDMKAKLLKKGDLTLRDTNFVEAMFAIRRVWGINIVVGNDLKGETVSCEFNDAPLHEILDTILSPRGYGYRPVGNSLVVLKLDAIRNSIPRFQSTTISVLYVDLAEVERSLAYYLSDRGQIQIVPSAKSMVVIDYPEQIEIISKKVAELDAKAKELQDKASADLKKAEELAMQAGNSAATGAPTAAAIVPGSLNKVTFFDLQFTKAENIAPAIQPLLNALGRVSVMPKDNRLVVWDTEDKLVVIADAVRQLDVPRPQVRIMALIYDVAIEDIRRLGVNWNRLGGTGNNLSSAGGTSVAQDSLVMSAITAAAPAAGAQNGSLTFTSLGSNFQLSAVVNALATTHDSRLLADPNVVIYDQEQAKIDSVREIPFQQLTQGSNGSNIGTTAFREAGITLTVTPQISNDDTLTLIVNPKFSVLAGLTPTNNQPIIDRREYTGTVRVRNRETIVIGGMRQREFIRDRSGIPYLMDIKGPIGKLFKNNNATVRESELIVFLTPEVIDTNYMGRDREHVIYANAVPSLDSVMHPRIPEHPCPLEDWQHRCGCQNKHKSYDPNCPDCQRCRTNYFQKDAGMPVAPQATPIQVQESIAPENVLPESLPYNTPTPAPPPQREPVPAPRTQPQYNSQPNINVPPPVETSNGVLDMGDPAVTRNVPPPSTLPPTALAPVKVRSAAVQPPARNNPYRANSKPYQDRDIMPAGATSIEPQRQPETRRLPPISQN